MTPDDAPMEKMVGMDPPRPVQQAQAGAHAIQSGSKPLSPAAGPSAATAGAEVRAIRRLLSVAAQGRGPEATAEGALESVLESTGAPVGSIWLLAPDGSPMRVASVGLTPAYLHAQSLFVGWNLVQEQLIALPDVSILSTDAFGILSATQLQLNQFIGVTSMAVLPLRSRHERVGVLMLGHPDPDGFACWSDDFLRVLAEIVATAVIQRGSAPALRRAGGSATLSVPLAHAPVTPAAQEERGPSPELLSQMLRGLDTGVALLEGRDARVLSHNPAFALLVTGASEASLTGLRLAELGLGERGTQLDALVRNAVEEHQTRRGVDLRGASATPANSRWSAVVAPVVPERPGRESRVVIALTDITERLALEDQLRHAHKMEAVGTLAGGIAHEFNNLLTAILGNVSLSLIDLPPDHALVSGLRDCEIAAMRAAELTRDLLGFGRRAPVSLNPVELGAVVQETLLRFESSLDARIRIERELPSVAVPVLADPLQLAQVVMNLCTNARDSMPSGGVLTVRLQAPAAEWSLPGRSGEFVCLEIQDTGDGIEPEFMARIYEPFFTTKGPDRGTGLGLSVVHAIVEQHGGWIECESTPGKGTTFRVHILRRHSGMPSHPSNAASGETVLVVEDEAVLRGLARAVLERLGYKVLLASDGIEALELVERGAHVDMILLDQTMPRMSGPETLLRLREIAPGIPVVLTSGYELGGGPPGPGGLLVDGFLPKPYAPEHLGATVREALDSKR